jgi:GR25 family glycosyltransferase involved in LPS biosynthesis
MNIDAIQWYYINLAERRDRLLHIHQELVKVGLTAERFDALRKEDYTGPPENVAMMQHTPNTIGNWLSHTSVIAKARPGETVGVLEDDALLCSDMRQRLRYVQNEFRQPWDIFFLGGTFHDDRAQWHPELGKDHELTGIRHIVRMYGAWSNQGYLINGDSSAKILEKMQRVMPQSTGSDHALIQIQPELQCFAFVPGMVFQIDGPSDIGDGVTKFSNFLKMGRYVWTDTLAEFDWNEWERAHV